MYFQNINLRYYESYREYQMSAGVILSLLNEFNKSVLCEPLASIILFYSKSSINLVMNLHEFNILFITYPRKRNINCKKDHFSPTRI